MYVTKKSRTFQLAIVSYTMSKDCQSDEFPAFAEKLENYIEFLRTNTPDACYVSLND